MYRRALGFSRISGLTRLGSVSWPRVAAALCRHQHRTSDSGSTKVKVSYQLFFKKNKKPNTLITVLGASYLMSNV